MATPRSNFVKLRLTDLEKQDWQTAAGGARKMSEWIRATCNAECNRLRRSELPDGVNPPYEEHQRSLGIPVADPVPNAKPLIVSDAIERELHEHGIQDSGLAVQVRDQAHRESRSLPATEVPGDDSSLDDRTAVPVEEAAARSLPPGAVIAVEPGEIVEHAVVKAANAECPRWMHHRPGTYCGTCKKVMPGKRIK